MKKLIPSYLRVLVLFFTVFAGVEFFVDSGHQPAFIKFPMISVFLVVFLFLLIAIEIVASAIDRVTYSILSDEQKKQLDDAQSVSFTESSFYKNIMAKLTRSKSIEQEADVMLDHDYDGIRELDNVLPPWWVYLFYGCVAFAIIYLVRFEVYGDYNQEQEYEESVRLAQIDIDKYNAAAPEKMSLDKVTLLTDAESLAKGKAIFENACVACHRADAGGQIGPNLTDEYWIDGGGIKHVFNTIMEGGREGKGMVAWKASMKPEDIQKIASYVLSLQGSNPKNPKPTEPEAVKYVDESAPATSETPKTETDSLKTVAVK